MGCSNILCLPPELVDVLYFVILLIANTLNCLISLASIYLMLKPLCRRRERPEPSAEALRAPVTLVVPCYLPNEQSIIEATVQHMLLKLEHAAPLTLYLVYNTPEPLEIEARLRALDGREYAPGRVLRVLRVDGSSSKAENLNAVMPLITDEFCAFYDADHHPDPNSLSLLLRAMLTTGCDAVQGSTYIRNTRGSLLAKFVNAEFFVTHFVYFPAMEVLSDNGYFGGSNALWRTGTLRRYRFDASTLTEDVDISARALLSCHRIRFCPTSRSGELAPKNLKSLVAQRLRWFMGWEQVTHKYYWRVFVSELRLSRKLGFCYMFHLRWVLLFAAVTAVVINPVVMSPFIYPIHTWSLAVQVCVYAAIGLCAFVFLLALRASLKHERSALSCLFVFLFMAGGWLYVAGHFALQTVAFVKVFTGKEGGWEVTSRCTAGISPLLRRLSPAGLARRPAAKPAEADAEAAEGACGRSSGAAAMSVPLLSGSSR